LTKVDLYLPLQFVQCCGDTGVDKGCPGPPNGRAKKENIFVKIEGLSSFTWSVLKSSDISTHLRLTRLTFDFEHHLLLLLLSSAARLQLQSLCCTKSDVQHVYLYSLFNWNSKVLLKNLVHKGVNFEAQNALKLTYTVWAPLILKNFRGYTPGPPLKGEEREGRPPNSHSWLRHCVGIVLNSAFI